MSIYTYLDLSTIHLTQKDVELLQKDNIKDVSAHETDYGFRVYIFNDTEDKSYLTEAGFSENFLNIVKFSIVSNCTFINFDCDGEEMKAFKSFPDEW